MRQGEYYPVTAIFVVAPTSMPEPMTNEPSNTTTRTTAIAQRVMLQQDFSTDSFILPQNNTIDAGEK
jgi:hypothetical protein